ncbi:hypothetical protein PAEPH01_0390 [Pancytospora epiphaga]|nr:hypothetical protein PAEPH01_0390 [Pancytospora epiphaga]
MVIPEYLLSTNDFNIGQCFIEFLKKNEKDYPSGAYVEIRFGSIISIVTESRPDLFSPHAIILEGMPAEYRFSNGITGRYYLEAKKLMSGNNVETYENSVSYNRTVRKVTSRGEFPEYQVKTRRIIGYLHLPMYAYDGQVSIVTIEKVENPDKTKSKYLCRKDRKIHKLVNGEFTLKIVQISPIVKEKEKGRVESNKEPEAKDCTHQAVLELPCNVRKFEEVHKILVEYVSKGFQCIKNNERGRRF